MERRETILEKAAQSLELPPEVAGLPRVELLGDKELRVEYHKGILSYGEKETHISTGKFIVRVIGEGLELRSMNAAQLIITGEIHGVELM